MSAAPATATATRSPIRGLIPPLLLGVLALTTAAEPMSINMYLAGLPQLGREFGIDQAAAQLTITFFLAGMAAGQLVAGPVSDSRGRRGLFLIGAAGLLAATAAAALAPGIWTFYLARLVQGLAGGTAVVLARAAVVDLVRGPDVARIFSILMLLGGIAPVLGPIIGGLLVEPVGWRGIFWVLVAVNAVILAGVYFAVPETLPAERRKASGFAPMLAGARALFSDGAYVGFTVAFIASFGTMFAYVAASAYVLQEHFGFTPVQYSAIFAANTSGLFVVGLINARIVRRVGPLRIAVAGNAVLLAAVAGLVAATLYDAPAPVILPLLFVTVASMGVNMPNNSALALSRATGIAGSASAFMGSGQFIVAGLLSPLVGAAAAAGMSQPVAMAAVMLVCAVTATASLHLAARAARRNPVSDA
ncbi:multidrug effflux MFS transporter [Corynebacterium hansenii]|uniref:Multidrug effflux MFS transporter n=1 Tax=Corynebacterium hansenii TaxID=394964 RepID=A0ABV7ZPY1_9CORY|nr:multidrug effflux MFS transporter [Corynebacterium hansenii]WJZ00406.1 Bicyclomycin resistance protein [Corynebacterium hansenii]